ASLGAVGARGVYNAGQWSELACRKLSPSSVVLHRLYDIDKRLEHFDVAAQREPSKKHIGIAVVAQPKLFELDADAVEPAVHVADVLHRARRPEALRDCRGSRPYARINRFEADVLGPHAGFASEHQRRLLRFEIVFRNRIHRVVSRGAEHMIEVVAV